MPKLVNHEERRRAIAEAVSRIARERGLQGVSFREVAREAGISVSLVQHYFGSKQNLLIGTLEIHSARLGELISTKLTELDSPGDPVARLRTIAASFIPTDPASKHIMLLYHAFAGAALTDASLRRADAFDSAQGLTSAMGQELIRAQEAGEYRGDFDPATEAEVILSLVLGLSLSILLEQTTPRAAVAVLDAHLGQLAVPRVT